MKKLQLILTVSVLLLFTSCKKDSSNPVSPDDNNNSGKISVGSTVELTTQTIGSSGGTIKINKPGDKLDGMEIIIPTNAFTQTKAFKISYADIKNHQFGEDFNPVTPLIRIDYGGGYADSVMTLKIPATIPNGQFAMGFYYDKESGKLEGIPVIAINNNEIVLATRHLSGEYLNNGTKLGKILGKTGTLETFVDIVVTTIQVSKLFELQDSGFRPGIDDWEFVNAGSYVAPRGHCTGQSMTAMWYYEVQKKGNNAPQLYGRYETIPGSFWQDNPFGYRFASTVWKDQVTQTRNAWLSEFNKLVTLRFNRDSLHYLAFAYSIHLTKMPQLTEIWNDSGGHAMIVYKADSRVLSIADPNFPSQYSHFITLGTDGKFVPYESKFNVNTPTVYFPEINYVAKSSLFSYEKIAQRWKEFENKTIGDDIFPTYDLMFKDGASALPVQDNMIYEEDTLKIFCKSTGAAGGINGTDKYLYVMVFDDKGNKISDTTDEKLGLLSVHLKPGLNKLCINPYGYNYDKSGWGYMDFKWVSVYCYFLKINPDPIVSKKNVEVTLTAKMKGMKPNPFKLVWNFGDGTSESTVNNDSTVKHTFMSEGSFNVHTKLYDGSNNLIAEAYAIANIQSDTKVAITSVYPVSSLPGLTIQVKGTWAKQTPPANSYFKINDQRVDPNNNNWSGDQVVLNVPQSTATGMGKVKVVYNGVESDPYSYYFGIPIDSIKTANVVRYKYSILLNCENGGTSSLLGIWPSSDMSYVPFTWQGTTFSATYTNSGTTSKITGTISSDGLYITSCKLEHSESNGSNVVLQLKQGGRISLYQSYHDNYVNVFSYPTTKHFPVPMYLIEKEELVSSFDATGVIHTSSGGDFQVKSVALKNGETSYSNFPIWFEKE